MTTTVKMRLSVMGHKRGDLVSVEDATARRWVRGRFADAVEGEETPEETIPELEAVEDERPTPGSRKDDWIEYAETIGVDTTDLTKREIIDAVDDLESPVVYEG